MRVHPRARSRTHTSDSQPLLAYSHSSPLLTPPSKKWALLPDCLSQVGTDPGTPDLNVDCVLGWRGQWIKRCQCGEDALSPACKAQWQSLPTTHEALSSSLTTKKQKEEQRKKRRRGNARRRGRRGRQIVGPTDAKRKGHKGKKQGWSGHSGCRALFTFHLGSSR